MRRRETGALQVWVVSDEGESIDPVQLLGSGGGSYREWVVDWQGRHTGRYVSGERVQALLEEVHRVDREVGWKTGRWQL